MKVNFTDDKSKRDFINNYDEWGVWFYEPRLGINYYKCQFMDGTEIIVEEESGVGLWSPRMVWAVRYHLIKPSGKYTLQSDSFIDVLNYLKKWTGITDVLIAE